MSLKKDTEYFELSLTSKRPNCFIYWPNCSWIKLKKYFPYFSLSRGTIDVKPFVFCTLKCHFFALQILEITFFSKICKIFISQRTNKISNLHKMFISNKDLTFKIFYYLENWLNTSRSRLDCGIYLGSTLYKLGDHVFIQARRSFLKSYR